MKKSLRISWIILLLNICIPFAALSQGSVAPGPEFGAFLERINQAEVNERQAIADSFITAQTAFPVIESDTIVAYIYTGNVSSVHIPGDANGWGSSAFPMSRIPDTKMWYRLENFETDARLDYKFILNGSNWILDPRNNNRVSGGFGPNSELRMPQYEFPTEINYRANIPHGSLKDTTVSSSVLNNSRRVYLYFPPGYDAAESKSYPMMLFHDGTEFLELANATNVLDFLIHEQRIVPMIGVFVPPVDRNNEYAWDHTANFEKFITEELVPVLEEKYSVSTLPAEKSMIGASYGGLITAQIVYNNPEVFGKAAILSTAFWAKNQTVYNQIMNGSKKEISWYIDWGTYEGSGITDYSPPFTAMLDEQGYAFKANIWHDGHSWGNWRAHVDEALEFFFPFSDSTSTELKIEDQPTAFKLNQNYPNPFNPSTKITFSLTKPTQLTLKVFDALGRELSVLAQGKYASGSYSIDFSGAGLSSGLYIYTLTTENGSSTRKMLLLK
ncbi:MAG: T9SS type A sorting domain-containing protein [Balneolaceae bacterium]|nr:T9SS type A sorting domain-containing protein [Balneolaceae bacterium]